MPGTIVSPSFSKKFSGFTGHGIRWGAARARERGPVIAGLIHPAQRNAIGMHSSAQAVYRAVALATGALQPDPPSGSGPTSPALRLGPYPQWFDPARIVSLDPWGQQVASAFAEQIAAGADIRPTIAVTRSHLRLPEIKAAIEAGRLVPDGDVLTLGGAVRVLKVGIDPVWWLPGVALRFGIKESTLRRALFEQTGGMFPELVTRPDLKVFLPPIGGTTLYLLGDPSRLGQPGTRVACRLHDECNGMDEFGSETCTCRPHLVHGIEVCVEMAQRGGVGLVIYNRKEGRALGEVSKFLVRHRWPAESESDGEGGRICFERTECASGVQGMPFQDLVPDVLHWLGIQRIDRLASTSQLKHDVLTAQGIAVIERVSAPGALLPLGAKAEAGTKKGTGSLVPCTCEAEPPTLLQGSRARGA